MSLLEFLRRDPACRGLAEGSVHALGPLLEDPDPAALLEVLEAWTFRLAGRMPLPWNLHLALDVVNDFLFRELALEGARVDFDAPEHAALPLVLRHKRGMPIALSILWIETCRRLGLDAVGIALPGHFITGLRAEPALLCFDPFHGGRAVDPALAADLVHQATGGAVAFTPDMLQPATDRAILVRLVRNLHARFARLADWPNALWTATHLVLLEPDHPRPYRDRAHVHYQRRDLRAAAADFRRALELSAYPDPELETWLRQLS